MKARTFRWMLCLGLIATPLRAGTGEQGPRRLSIAASEGSSSAGEDAELRPLKKRVGRAVTSTMDKIDNPWFVVSQILIPLCAFLFSMIYVRRYRARRAAQTSQNPCAAEDAHGNSPQDDVETPRAEIRQDETVSEGEVKK